MTLSKTWLIKHGSNNHEGTSVTDIMNQNIDDEETSHQEKHWGEILERTCSKSNLMLVNGNHNKVSCHETFPRVKVSKQMCEDRSSVSLEMNGHQTFSVANF